MAPTPPKLTSQILFEAVIGLWITAAVTFFWSRPWWALTALALGAAGQIWFWRDRTDVLVMIFAALLGTPSEIMCIRQGIWTYYAPGLILGVPLWLPLVWANLFCLFRRMTGTGMILADLYLPKSGKARKPAFLLLGLAILIYTAGTLAVIRRSIAIFGAVFFIPTAWFWHDERDRLVFLVGGILGTFGEFICMRLGFWKYHFPVFASIGMPLSLPLAWGLSGVIITRLAGAFDRSAKLESDGKREGSAI